MKTNRILILFLLTVCILSNCDVKEVDPGSIERHAVSAFLDQFFEDNRPAHSYSIEGFLSAFNQDFDTDYSRQTIDDYGSAYRETMQSKGINTTLSADDSEFDITELEEIEGYDYFHTLYNYETTPVNLDDLVTKALNDISLSEEVASSILGLIYIKQLFTSQTDHYMVMSSQCPDTPGNARCINDCESDRDTDYNRLYRSMLTDIGVTIGLGISGGPVGIGIGVVYTIGGSILGQTVIELDYQKCVRRCNDYFPCQ